MKSILKKAICLMMVFVLTVGFVSVLKQNEVEAKAKVKINHKKMTMNAGDWKKLKLKNLKYEVGDITWSTSNKYVAKVSRKGWVLAVFRGECTITAEVKATGKKYTCNVTVAAPDVTQRVIDPTKPIIALTFDDGPNANTPGLLETLKYYGVTATFFMCNNNCVSNGISVYADTIRDMYTYGCEIANHTMKHPSLTSLSAEGIRAEVNGNAEKIREVIGNDQRILLRPPYGACNETVKANAGTALINWTVDTQDWAVTKSSNPTEQIMANLKKEAHDGYIILMHDIHKTSCEAAKTVIPWLIEQGYQVCSVSEMFNARGVKLEDGVLYNKCITAEQYKELHKDELEAKSEKQETVETTEQKTETTEQKTETTEQKTETEEKEEVVVKG